MNLNFLKKHFLRFSLLAILAVGGIQTPTIDAQCPMCRMSAETNMKNGGKAGNGLNAGILYMFSMPYLIIFGIGIWWYRNQKVKGSEVIAQEVIQDPSRLN